MAARGAGFYTPRISSCAAVMTAIGMTAIGMTATVTALNLDTFLAASERRAYRMALLATKRSADALDIVQDAMLQLVQHYRQRTPQEWPLLFQRILQNRILDWHRQQTRQRRWFLHGGQRGQAGAIGVESEDEEDIIATLADPRENNPQELLQRAGDVETVLRVVEQLPLRQQQAFLLRAWEGLDVAETAAAMQCSEGSVKTHFFRALQTLRAALESDGKISDGNEKRP